MVIGSHDCTCMVLGRLSKSLLALRVGQPVPHGCQREKRRGGPC
ncbi:hypothetical protein BSLA_01f5337 [Burkholderia stabilis]|nr:hypothetical protein BSLA_01f5337 [Burkholderia stabilis]